MFQKNRIKVIIYIILSFFLVLGSQLFLKDLPYQVPSLKRLIVSCLIILLFWILIIKVKENIIPKIGITIILCFGIASAVLKPVQVGLDEEAHLNGTLAVRQSGILKYENYTTNEYDTIFKHDFFRNKVEFTKSGSFYLEKHKKDSYSGKVLSINNFAYIPSAIGWYIGELLSSKIFVSYYLGRIFNVLAFVILVLISYRVCKESQKIIFLITSFPSYLYFVSGYHYDSIYYGISAIVFAIIYKYFINKENLQRKDLLLYVFSCVMFTFVKFPFVLLGLFLFMIPRERFGSLKNKLIWSCLAFLQLFFSFYYYLGFSAEKQSSNVEVPSILFFIKHPLPIIRTFLDIPDVFEFNIRYTQIFAKTYSATSMVFSEVVFILLIFALATRVEIKLPKIFMYIFGIFAVGICYLIIYAITSDPRTYHIGMTYVPGVQGRYFYFFAFFLPLFLSSFSKRLFMIRDDKLSIETGDSYLNSFMINALIFLNILNLGITMYTMVPY